MLSSLSPAILLFPRYLPRAILLGIHIPEDLLNIQKHHLLFWFGVFEMVIFTFFVCLVEDLRPIAPEISICVPNTYNYVGTYVCILFLLRFGVKRRRHFGSVKHT